MRKKTIPAASRLNLSHYFAEIRKLNGVYPDDGGRERLYELVGN